MLELPTNQPQPVAKILDDGMKLFFYSFPKVLPLVLADVLLSAMLHLIVPELNSPEPAVVIEALTNSVFYLFFYAVAMLILQAAIFYRIGMIFTQSDSGNIPALLQGVKKLLPIVLATWLYTFLSAVGLLILIPGILFAVSLRFFTPLILFDNATVLESLQHSHKLVWGNWWHTAMVLLIPLTMIFSVALLSSMIVETVLNSSTTLAAEQVNLVIQITYKIVDKLLNPLFYALIVVQFYELKRLNQSHRPVENQLIA